MHDASPPPPSPPPPVPPALQVIKGWCSNWQVYKGDDGQNNVVLHRTDDGAQLRDAQLWGERDQAACFAQCDGLTACMQAIFETAEGPLGPQCWMGLNNMTSAPDAARPACRDTAGCTDYCYSKHGWARDLTLTGNTDDDDDDDDDVDDDDDDDK